MHASSESNPEGAILQLYFKYSRVCFKSGPRSFGTQPADILELFVVGDCMDVVMRDTQLGGNVNSVTRLSAMIMSLIVIQCDICF